MVMLRNGNSTSHPLHLLSWTPKSVCLYDRYRRSLTCDKANSALFEILNKVSAWICRGSSGTKRVEMSVRCITLSPSRLSRSVILRSRSNLIFTNFTALGLKSIPIHCLCGASAAMQVVAQPQNGSRTISLGLLLALMMRFKNSSGFWVGKPVRFSDILPTRFMSVQIDFNQVQLNPHFSNADHQDQNVYTILIRSHLRVHNFDSKSRHALHNIAVYLKLVHIASRYCFQYDVPM